MAFPEQRLRRLRRTPALRALARETRLHPGDLIDALFVVEGRAVREPISSMPGVLRLPSTSSPTRRSGSATSVWAA